MEDDRVDAGAIPKALQASVKRFGGMRRRVRLTLTSGSTSSGANDILRIRLPTNSLVDLRTFGFNADLSCNAVSFVGGTHTLVRRVGLVAGGVNINFQNNYWNQTAHAMNVAGQGLEWDRSNVLAGCNPDDAQFATNGDFVEFNYWPLSPMTAGIIDTGLIGECEVDLVFDSAAALITKEGEAVTGSFTLSSIRAYVDVIDLESDFYRKFASAALGRGKTMVKMMELATCVIQASTGSNNFNVSTGCLDKILVAPKASAWATAQAQAAGEVYDRYLDFNCGVAYGSVDDNYSAYVQIGSTSFPAYGFGRKFPDLASITRNNWAGSSYNYNKLFLQTDGSGSTVGTASLVYTPAAYNRHNAIVLIPVGAFDEHGKQGGIDLSSGNSVIRVETTGANLINGNSQLLMAGIHKSLLQVQSGQVVSYTN